MSLHSSPSLLVLTGLRLVSFAPADRIAGAIGLDDAVVEAELDRLSAVGFVRHREGRLSGWMLTGEGRAEGERLLAAELDDAALRPEIESAYRRFLELNQPLLDVCSAWQLREIDGELVPNDHGDETHDAAAITELARIDDAVGPLCEELGSHLTRFSNYRGRLAAACARVEAGERDWFTRPTVDSYHTVWFELHEHLLATLGIERGKETHG